MNTEEFIEKAVAKHGNKYDYSKVKYVGTSTPVCIICPEHGEFWQRPNNHLNGRGCNKCGLKLRGEKRRRSYEDFIEKAKKVHGDKYDYSEVNYTTCKDKVTIICPEHGEFLITPDNHLQGQGCPVCRYIKSASAIRKNLNDVIDDFKRVHGDKYDYSRVTYKNNKTKVRIICPEHGEFWQTPDNHIKGKGCPHCSQSKLESSTRDFLVENGIEFVEQKGFDWLRYKNPMKLDFYLPEYNVAIECQGIQHFESFKHFGGDDGLEYSTAKDIKKASLCSDNNVGLLYYSNEKYDSYLGKKVYHSLSKLIKEVKQNKTLKR